MVTKISTFLCLISFFLLVSSSYSKSVRECLHKCIYNHKILFFSNDPSFEPILEYNIQNLRFVNHSTPRPLAIVTPLKYAHVQSAILCAKKCGLKIRTRSGGNDFEGMSYTSRYIAPFLLVDLVNLTKVHVNLKRETKTAWIEAGATVGQVYYWINNKTQDYSFVGSVNPLVGAVGLIAGGGVSYLSRKYGSASDTVVDALIIDVNGSILNRKSMGEDLFWAIRGGGASSFGIIVAWKVQLVPIPRKVTVFVTTRNSEQGGIDLAQKAQLAFARDMDERLRLRLEISASDGTPKAKFTTIFLGTTEELLTAMDKSFPELGLTRKDCTEMSWVDAIIYFNYPKGEPLESLRDRKPLAKINFKAKSDFVTEAEPLSKAVIEEIWKRSSENSYFLQVMHFYGGRLNEIPEDQTAFPFRKGILYDIEYLAAWPEPDAETAEKNIEFLRSLYEYMTPYVSKNPRGAYSGYRDYDLGINKVFGGTYEEAKKWGVMYYKSNFKRLAEVKGKVDPEDFFALEQTIPPLVREELFSPSTAAI